MQNEDQHNQAIQPTVKVKESVSCAIFDDKVREAGRINVENGFITIKLDHGFHLATEKDTKAFLIESISLGLEQCFNARPESFDPY